MGCNLVLLYPKVTGHSERVLYFGSLEWEQHQVRSSLKELLRERYRSFLFSLLLVAEAQTV